MGHPELCYVQEREMTMKLITLSVLLLTGCTTTYVEIYDSSIYLEVDPEIAAGIGDAGCE